MSRPKPSSSNKEWGVRGPGRKLRTFLQFAVFIPVIWAVNVRPGGLAVAFYLGFGAALLAVIDVVMLLRGDLDYTHFQSRDVSFKINAVLFMLGFALLLAGLLGYAP
ncbi:MAG: hypothetical protein ACRDKT_15995 [Actinomycetota bacterium]